MVIIHNKPIDKNIDLDEYSIETNKKFVRTTNSDKVLQWKTQLISQRVLYVKRCPS